MTALPTCGVETNETTLVVAAAFVPLSVDWTTPTAAIAASEMTMPMASAEAPLKVATPVRVPVAPAATEFSVDKLNPYPWAALSYVALCWLVMPDGAVKTYDPVARDELAPPTQIKSSADKAVTPVRAMLTGLAL